MYSSKYTSNQIVLFFFVLCLSLLLIPNIMLLTFVLIIFSGILLIYTRHNLMAFLSALIVAYSNYSLVVYRYWGRDLMDDYNSFSQKPEIDLTALRIVTFFTIILVVILWRFQNKQIFHNFSHDIICHERTRSNPILVFLTCITLVVIWVLYYSFSFGEQAGYSPQYEYSTVFFIIGLKYTGNSKFLTTLLLLLACFYILFDFLGGQRSTGVQIALIVVLMKFYKYLTPKLVLTMVLSGMILTRLVATFRASLFMTDFTIGDILSSMTETMFASDTAGQAYYTSLTFVATMDIYPLITRLGQFGDFVTSIFVSGADEGLAWICNRHFEHGFGGILGIYMYYYLGYLGTFLIACLVGFYYKMMMVTTSSLSQLNNWAFIVCVYVAATTIRWYVYSPSQLLRGVLLLSLVYYGYTILNKITKFKKV